MICNTLKSLPTPHKIDFTYISNTEPLYTCLAIDYGLDLDYSHFPDHLGNPECQCIRI